MSSEIMPILVCHGGAGDIPDSRVGPKLEGLRRAVTAGYQILQGPNSELVEDGKTMSDALRACIAAVSVMEDEEPFNAGFGSVLNEDGEIEMDAAVMEGRDLGYGAVAGIKDVKNAIQVAGKVLLHSEHCFFAGPGSNRFAERVGVPKVAEPQKMISKWSREALQAALAGGKMTNETGDKPRGTVGAVAMDKDGNLAAATSTGGLSAKQLGRVGDSPVIGAGVYADNEEGAVSTTGLGESMLRTLIAKAIGSRMTGTEDANAMIKSELDKMTDRVGGDGGAIAINRAGALGIEFNSERMAWAYAREGRLYYGCNRGENFEEEIR